MLRSGELLAARRDELFDLVASTNADVPLKQVKAARDQQPLPIWRSRSSGGTHQRQAAICLCQPLGDQPMNHG